jgi:signal transduction histidine kinase
MRKLLDDLLLYAKAGSTLDQPETVNTYKLVSDVIQLLPIPKDFSVVIDQNLPTLITYRIPLQQIFHNLISNAINHHHCPDQGKIQISAHDHGLYTAFSVTDNGPGIPKRDHQKIFNMFYKLKQKEENYGSGVGLAIVKKLIDRMDGQMIINSSPGKGSTFTFMWPKDRSHRNGGSSKPLSFRECN